MKYHKNRSPGCVVISGLTGIIVFLVLLVILGYLASYFNNAFLLGFVSLLVDNLSLIITMGIVFMVADIFSSFRYPFNLPGPLFSGLGACCSQPDLHPPGFFRFMVWSRDVGHVFEFQVYLLSPRLFHRCNYRIRTIFSPEITRNDVPRKQKQTLRHALSARPGEMSVMKSGRQFSISFTGSGKK